MRFACSLAPAITDRLSPKHNRNRNNLQIRSEIIIGSTGNLLARPDDEQPTSYPACSNSMIPFILS
ncbi:MAG: hypothetical protein D6698_00105 [Gammaproteobacteria bacterium]|nr:MAG: hypothetical protein D6698_00105 [Gammaproteobacteria bacterium]